MCIPPAQLYSATRKEPDSLGAKLTGGPSQLEGPLRVTANAMSPVHCTSVT